MNEAFDVKDEVGDIKKEMGDCDIPVNIQVRRNEVSAFTDRLNRIKQDFKDLKQADDDFEGESSSEKEIKELIAKIEQRLRQFDQEAREFSRFQSTKLDLYKDQDFTSYHN